MRLRLPRVPELHVPIVTDADVAADDAVRRQHRLAIGDHALRPHRRGVDIEIRPNECFPLGAPFRDVGEPFLGVGLGATPLQLGKKLAQEGARVGEDAEVRRIIAAELGRIDVDMDELCVRKIPRIAGHPRRRRAVVEARADGDHHVRPAAGFVGGKRAVAPDEAERQRIGHVDAAHAVGRRDHRDAEFFGKLGQFAAGFRQRDAVADEEHRPLRVKDHVERARDVVRRGAASLGVKRRRRRRHLDVVFFLKDVERHVDIHRARPAGQHRGHGLAQRQRQHVDAGRLETVLHHRAQHIDEIGLKMPVDLLERAAVELRGRHVGGDGEHGRRIGQRAGQRHDDIGRARPARGQRRHRLVAHPEIGVRHMGRDLLVARRNELDAVARLVERIEHADIAVAAYAEDIRNIVGDQIVGDQLGALHAWHCGSFRSSRRVCGAT